MLRPLRFRPETCATVPLLCLSPYSSTVSRDDVGIAVRYHRVWGTRSVHIILPAFKSRGCPLSLLNPKDTVCIRTMSCDLRRVQCGCSVSLTDVDRVQNSKSLFL